MGFLRRLFGGKKPDHPSVGSDPKPPKDKRKWSFAKHTKQKSRPNSQQQSSPLTYFESSTTTSFPDSLDANKHAIAVAAATAAVAEAALAAAHAAAEVVRLTSGGSGSGTGTVAYGGVTRPAAASFVGASQRRRVEELAAVRLQSAFRAYLARRALRALKALVKLQALVRGHIVRRQTADMLRRMQTLVRLQARARASRVHLSDHMHSTKSSLLYHPVPEDHEHPLCAYNTKFEGSSILKRCSSNANFRDVGPERPRLGSNWLDRWMEESVWTQHPRDGSLRHGHTDDDKSDKILEVDSWKPPHLSSHRSSSSFHASQFYPTSDYNNEMMMMAYDSPSKRSGKFPNQGALSLKFHKGKEVAAAIASRTAENSPQALSASSRYANGVGGSRRGGGGGPFTPTRSECSWGYFGGYAGHPNYMANTESSKAKVRSQSAPKQRLEFERYGSTTGRNFQGLWDSDYTDRDFRGRGYYYPAASSHLNRVGSTNLR